MNALVLLALALVVEYGIVAKGEVEGIHFVDSKVDVVTKLAAFENSTGRVRVVDGSANFTRFSGDVYLRNSSAWIVNSDASITCENSTVYVLHSRVSRAVFESCKVFASLNEFSDLVVSPDSYWAGMTVAYAYNGSVYQGLAGNYWRSMEVKDEDSDGLSDLKVCPKVRLPSGLTDSVFCEYAAVSPLDSYVVHNYWPLNMSAPVASTERAEYPWFVLILAACAAAAVAAAILLRRKRSS